MFVGSWLNANANARLLLRCRITMITRTHAHRNVLTLKGVGVKGFVGERLRNKPLRVSASYDHEGKHRYSPVHITIKTTVFPSENP